MSEAKELLNQAVAAEEAGRFAEAERLYVQCIEAAPASHTDTSVWLHYAFVLREQKKWASAIEAFSKVLKSKKPSRLMLAYVYIASCHQALEQFAEAEHDYRQALAIEPKAFTWVFLSSLLFQLDRDDEAMDCLRETLEVDPDYEEAHYLLGCGYRRDKQLDLAEQHLRRAIEIDPEYALAYAELGKLVYHCALDSLRSSDSDEGALAEARQLLMKAIELDSSNAWPRIYLANVMWHLGKTKAAEEHYQAALQLWPDAAVTNWAYGDFLSARNIDHAKAGQLLKKAVELEPNDPSAHYYLGKHYLRCHRKFKAKQALREAARLGSGHAAKLLSELETG